MSEIDRVDASWMGNAFSKDPDLSIPEKPRLIAELVILQIEPDGLMFVGSEHVQVLRGRSASTLVPYLMKFFDGRRTIDDLVEQLPDVPKRTIHDVVSLLFSRGLLEDGHGPPMVDSHLANLSSFLGRHNDVSRCNRNREVALERLVHSSIHISGPPEPTESLVRELRALGVHSISTNDSTTHPNCDLLVAISTSDRSESQELVARRWSTGKKCLLIRLGQAEATFGPLLERNVSSCPGCFMQLHAHPIGSPAALVGRLWIGLASLYILQALSRLTLGLTQASFKLVRFGAEGELSEDTRLAPRMPGCADCGLAEAGLPRAISIHNDARMLAWIYHSATSIVSRDMFGPKDHQAHYIAANIKLARASRPSVIGQRLPPLPAPGLLRNRERAADRRGEPTERLELSSLSTFLAWVGGEVEEDGRRRRLVPTGGNLGSVGIWALVRDIEGIRPGVYSYDAAHHQLIYVRAIPEVPINGALGREKATLQQCILVGTGALSRCVEKYGLFAYRLVYFDSGVTTAYAHAVADALGLPISEFPSYDDRQVLAILGVAPRWEVVPTFVLGIGEVSGEAADLDERTFDASNLGASRLQQRDLRCDDYSFDVLATLLESAAAACAPIAPARPVAPARAEHVPLIPAGTSLGHVLKARRAVRKFSNDPIKTSVIAELMILAASAAEVRWSAGASACTVRPVVVIAKDSSEVAAGMYELAYDGTLARRSNSGKITMHDFVNQISIAGSWLAIVMIGDLVAALGDRDVRGYREMAQHAGAAIGRAWIAATARGLVGTAAGGMIASGFREAAAMDGFRECPLLGLHLGHPVANAQPRHDLDYEIAATTLGGARPARASR